MGRFDIARILLSLPGILIGLTLHEYAHARTATALGDETPAAEGRLSLNPLRHIDPLGFLFIVIAGFGWAKPVRFSRDHLGHRRRDEMLIALAGPLANLVLGALFALLLKAVIVAGFYRGGVGGGAVGNAILTAMLINYGLFIFNILPIPPLDGSHILFQSLRIGESLEAKLYRYGSWILLAVILLQSQIGIDILPIDKAVNFLGTLSLRLLGVLR